MLAVCLLAVTPALAQVDQATAALGIGANHGTLSFAPWEQIDTFTGNVLLSFTDINLPGDAGFNLTIRRYYNSKTSFYPNFDYGFPYIKTTAPYSIIPYPVIETGDGSRMRMLRDLTDPTLYLTTSRWRLRVPSTISTRTLETPNGVRYVYDADDHPLYKEDAFGNRIDVVADPGSSGWRVGSLVQHLGNNRTRTVSFGYDLNGILTTLTANGRTWTYSRVAGTSTATDPAGATWTASWTAGPPLDPVEWDASSDALTITTPTGGWVRYYVVFHGSYAPDPLPGESPRPPHDPRWLDSAVRQRDTGGPDITPATLRFTYESANDDGNNLITHVEGTNGTTFYSDYTYSWSPGAYSSIDQSHVLGTVTNPARTESFLYTACLVPGLAEQDPEQQPLSSNQFPLAISQTSTQAGRTYTQEWTQYSCTFGQPLTVVTGGDFTRTTTYDYQSFTGSTYLADRPWRINVQGLATTMEYDGNTGFMTARTAAGVRTTFAPDSHGNVGTQTVINAQNSGVTQTTTFDHDWGVVSGAHTALSDVTMVINEDGSVHTKTQVGRTTQEARTTHL